MILASFRNIPVEVTDARDGLVEVITLDGSTPFRVIGSSKAVAHGAPGVVHLSSGFVRLEELENVGVVLDVPEVVEALPLPCL